MISGLKRPCPDEEGESSRCPDTPVKRRGFVSVSASETVGAIFESAISSETRPNIDRCNKHNTYRDGIPRAYEPSPKEWLSSPSSGDAIEISSRTWTPATSTSNAEGLEFGKDSNDIEICFGMLVDGLLSPWKVSPRSKLSNSKIEAQTLKPRFRNNAITIINPAGQEIGVLDKNVATGMVSLKKTISSVQFEIYVAPGPKQVQSRGGRQEVPLEILILGPRSSLEQVGSLLSESSLFLQEPINHKLSVCYRNPHVFSWDDQEEDDGLNSSYLLRPSSGNQIDFMDKIHNVLNETNAPRLSFNITQDARITSTLKQHQLVALKFMIAREGLMGSDRLTLWKPVDRNGRQAFKNEITDSIKILEPVGCRGGILADEMGMGKSLSLLALILYTLQDQNSGIKENSHPPDSEDQVSSPATLIIAPKSTIQGWEEQVKKHTLPGALKVHIYHGNGRKITRERLSQFDIVLTTYETVATNASASGILSAISWLRIVLDEAHQIRNRSTRNFQELTKLHAERRWCLTGTPVQNRLGDLFSLTQFIGFEPLENHANARKYILEPLSRKDSQGLENLRLALQVISLRRTKGSCSNRRRYETVENVILSERERCRYIATRDEAKRALTSAPSKTQGSILLRALSSLRQICSHGGSIIDAIQDIHSSLEHNNCDKCGDPIDTQQDSQKSFHGTCGHNVCYECTVDQSGADCTTLDGAPSVCWICQEPVFEDVRQLSDNPVQNTLMDWEPATPLAATSHSSKIDKVVESLLRLEQDSPGNYMEPIKSLVFSHWTRTLDCLEKALSRQNMLYARIDGRLSVEQRRTIIHEFNTTPKIRILLLSYQSGSVGLNLEIATHVHLLEPHWNPMVEAQAAARVDRLSQTKDIHIYRYIVKDSIEENIQKAQRGKLKDAELSVSRMATGEDSKNNDFGELRDLL